MKIIVRRAFYPVYQIVIKSIIHDFLEEHRDFESANDVERYINSLFERDFSTDTINESESESDNENDIFDPSHP